MEVTQSQNSLVSSPNSDFNVGTRRQSRRIEVKRKDEQYWLQHNFPNIAVLQSMVDGAGSFNGLQGGSRESSVVKSIGRATPAVRTDLASAEAPVSDGSRSSHAGSDHQQKSTTTQGIGTACNGTQAAPRGAKRPPSTPPGRGGRVPQLNGEHCGSVAQNGLEGSETPSNKASSSGSKAKRKKRTGDSLTDNVQAGAIVSNGVGGGHSSLPSQSRLQNAGSTAPLGSASSAAVTTTPGQFQHHGHTQLPPLSSSLSASSLIPHSVSSTSASFSVPLAHNLAQGDFDDNDDDYIPLPSPDDAALSPALSDDNHDFSAEMAAGCSLHAASETMMVNDNASPAGSARNLSCIPMSRLPYRSLESPVAGMPVSPSMCSVGVCQYQPGNAMNRRQSPSLSTASPAIFSESESDSDSEDDPDLPEMPPLIALSEIRKASDSGVVVVGAPRATATTASISPVRRQSPPREGQAESESPHRPLAASNAKSSQVSVPLSSEKAVSDSMSVSSQPKQQQRRQPVARLSAGAQSLLHQDNLAQSNRLRRMASKNASACINALVAANPVAQSTAASHSLSASSFVHVIHTADAAAPSARSMHEHASAEPRRHRGRTARPQKPPPPATQGPESSDEQGPALTRSPTRCRSMSPVIRISRHPGSPPPKSPVRSPQRPPTVAMDYVSKSSPGRQMMMAAGSEGDGVVLSCFSMSRPSRLASQNARAIMSIQGERNSSPLAYPLPGSAQKQKRVTVAETKPSGRSSQGSHHDNRNCSATTAVESNMSQQSSSSSGSSKRDKGGRSADSKSHQFAAASVSSPSASKNRDVPSGGNTTGDNTGNRNDGDESGVDGDDSPAMTPGKSKVPRASTIMKRLTSTLKEDEEVECEKWKALDEQYLYPLISSLNIAMFDNPTPSSSSKGGDVGEGARVPGPLAGVTSSAAQPPSSLPSSTARSGRCSRNSSQTMSASMMARLSKPPNLPATHGWRARTISNIETEMNSGRVRYSFRSLEHKRREPISVGQNVLLSAGRRRAPFVGNLLQITQEEDEDIQILVSWFYREYDLACPVDNGSGGGITSSAASANADDRSAELFSSDHSDLNSVSSLIGRCYVTSQQDYILYRGRRKRRQLRIGSSGDGGGRPRNACVPELRMTLRPAQDLDAAVPATIEQSRVFFCWQMYDHTAGKLRQRRDIHSRIIQPTQTKRKFGSRG